MLTVIQLRKRVLLLTLGLRRLAHWKRKLQQLLLLLRKGLQGTKAIQLPLLPVSLERTTVVWMVETMEDLYLLLNSVEIQTEQTLATLQKR